MSICKICFVDKLKQQHKEYCHYCDAVEQLKDMFGITDEIPGKVSQNTDNK